jgi:hypothetical protein
MRGIVGRVSNPETQSSDEESQLPPGTEPTMLENLKEMQRLYSLRGIQMTLREVYDLEVENPEEEEEEDEGGSPPDQG